uniref:Uncharacterized protein n=1 Tax=Glossina austeni TaxID=7395 RepID=A0A1A9UUM0_GLOAU
MRRLSFMGGLFENHLQHQCPSKQIESRLYNKVIKLKKQKTKEEMQFTLTSKPPLYSSIPSACRVACDRKRKQDAYVKFKDKSKIKRVNRQQSAYRKSVLKVIAIKTLRTLRFRQPRIQSNREQLIPRNLASLRDLSSKSATTCTERMSERTNRHNGRLTPLTLSID